MKTQMLSLIGKALLATLVLVVLLITAGYSAKAESEESHGQVTRVPVIFTGGHQTEEVDHGRPVVLIAAALGVKPEVFREAFSHVHPASPDGGGPTEAEARQNKAALLNALGKFAVTNERLDIVSDFYRYRPESEKIWKHKPAAASALVKGGVVIGYEITSGGAGYTTPPTVSVSGIKGAFAKVEISFGKDIETNGAVSKITVSQENRK